MKNLCETCAHYRECGTRLVIHVMENGIKCKAYEEKNEKNLHTYCDKKDGCQMCDLLLCDKKENKRKNISGLIICGFPGVGKSAASNKCQQAIDCESTRFHTASAQEEITYFAEGKEYVSEVKNDWVSPYVDFIVQEATEKSGCYILASCHSLVRKELQRRKVPFICVIPSEELRDEYLARYVKRGDSAQFISKINKYWYKWLNEFDSNYCTEVPVIRLKDGQVLSDILPIPK